MTAVLFSSNMPSNVFAQEGVDENSIITDDVTISSSALSIISPEIDVDFTVTAQWNDGFTGEIEIKNVSDKSIENWQIEMTFPQEITNIWNAKIDSIGNGVYNIKNAGGNNNVDIPVGSSVAFGFTGTYTDSIVAPTNIKLITGKQNASDEEYSIDYQLMSDWNSGFTAQVVINNNMDTPMESWHLEFDFTGEITSIWNGIIEKSENGRYYISNAGYNSVIPAHESMNIGINGIYSESKETPQNYVLIHSGNANYTSGGKIENSENNENTDNRGVAVVVDGSSFSEFTDLGMGCFIDGIYSSISGSLSGSENISRFYYQIKKHDGTLLYENELEVAENWEIKDIDTSEKHCMIDIIAVTDNEEQPVIYTVNFICDEDLIDNDEDGLINLLEEYLGTDMDSEDSDGDELSDYYELFILGTSPLENDTDGDTISDADEDNDGDGLTNFEEIQLGTSPVSPDSDSDELTDHEEIKIYNTDPLKYDTDEDSLSDKDDILLGFDPNIYDTDNNGVKDGDEKVLQTYSYKVDCPESPALTDVKIETEVAGNIANITDIKATYNINQYTTDLVGLVGTPLDITINSDFEKAKVTFVYDVSKIDCENDLGVFWYNKETGLFEDMNAEIDKVNHEISFETTHFSEYCLCNTKLFYNTIDTFKKYFVPFIEKTIYINDAGFQWKVIGADEVPTFKGNSLFNLTGGNDVYVSKGYIVYNMKDGKYLRQKITILSPTANYIPVLENDDGFASILPNEFYAAFMQGWYGTYEQPKDENGKSVYSVLYDDIDINNFGGFEITDRYFVFADESKLDITKDTDCDGLNDYVEKFGMLLSNASIKYTDFDNPDSDGDTLTDAAEMGPYNTETGFFTYLSDPQSSDSDGDKYIDKEDSYPMIKNVHEYKLSDESYISIYYNGTNKSYGGNQGWFTYPNDKYSALRLIANGGCGIISASDMILFLQKNHSLLNNATIVDTNYSKGEAINHEQYKGFIEDMAQNYLIPFDLNKSFSFLGEENADFWADILSDNADTWGIDPLSYTVGVNKYLSERNYSVRFYPLYLSKGVGIEASYKFDYALLTKIVQSEKNGDCNLCSYYPFEIFDNDLNIKIKNSSEERIINEKIIELLRENIPVPVMIGVGGRIHNYNDEKLEYIDRNNPLLESHWVNITGIIYDDISDRVVGEISTWGKKRYINMEELYKYPGYFGAVVFPYLSESNILEVA